MGWPDFLARCLIGTASSRHGETATGCGSIAAVRSFPTKRDMNGSDVRRRDRNMGRDRPSFWNLRVGEMPAARRARGGFSLVRVWRKRHED